MDAIGYMGIGIGGYIMYAAVKNEHPWQAFLQIFAGAKSSSGSIGGPSAIGPGTPGFGSIGPKFTTTT